MEKWALLSTVKQSVLLRLTCICNAFPVKIPVGFLIECDG